MKIADLKVWNGESECSNLTIFRALLNNLARTSSITRLKLGTRKKQLSYPPPTAPCTLSYVLPSLARTGFCESLLTFFSFAIDEFVTWLLSPRVRLFYFFLLVTGCTGLCVRIYRFHWRSVWSNVAVGIIFFIYQYTCCWCRYILTSRFSSVFGVRRVLCGSRSSAIRIARYTYCLPILLRSRSHAVHKIQHHWRPIGFVLLELS